jgi:hypothetical protein
LNTRPIDAPATDRRRTPSPCRRRRRSARRAIPYKQVVLAAFDLQIDADQRSVDELAQAFLAS